MIIAVGISIVPEITKPQSGSKLAQLGAQAAQQAAQQAAGDPSDSSSPWAVAAC